MSHHVPLDNISTQGWLNLYNLWGHLPSAIVRDERRSQPRKDILVAHVEETNSLGVGRIGGFPNTSCHMHAECGQPGYK